MDIAYLKNDPELLVAIKGEKAIGEINNLLRQISPAARIINRRDLEDIYRFGTFFSAIENNTSNVVGIVTLTRVYKPTGFFGTMEDLVVDKNCAKNGIGSTLIEMLIREARLQGMEYVYFTSNPKRFEANRLYLKMGAKKNETNAYCFEL